MISKLHTNRLQSLSICGHEVDKGLVSMMNRAEVPFALVWAAYTAGFVIKAQYDVLNAENVFMLYDFRGSKEITYGPVKGLEALRVLLLMTGGISVDTQRTGM